MSMQRRVEVPPRLARRPRDAQGFPIPAGVRVTTQGTPDFKAVDVHKWAALINAKCCGLCGEALTSDVAFVGGPQCHKSRLFTDLPMHRECAVYALKVCPYLAAPRLSREQIERALPASVLGRFSLGRPAYQPDRFFLGITHSFSVVEAPDGSLAIHAGMWSLTQWWEEGVAVAGDLDASPP